MRLLNAEGTKMANTLLTISKITNEALYGLENKLTFTSEDQSRIRRSICGFRREDWRNR